MNARRFNRGSHSKSLTPSPADRRALGEPDFLPAIWHERKRAERTRKSCVLMLVEMESQFPTDRHGLALETILSALSSATRETDLTGWYRDQRVVGVLFTEIVSEDGAAIVTTVMARVSEALRTRLTSRQFNQANISFHLFPGERERAIPAFYPGLVQAGLVRPEPSGSLVSHDLVSHDLVSHDLVSRDLVSRDLAAQDLVPQELMQEGLVQG
jgi:hypothetical protein